MVRELLFKLLCSTLWGDTFKTKLSAEEFCGLVSLAEIQTVFGLVMDALKSACVEGIEDKAPIFEAIGVMELIKQQNRAINKELLEFASLCEDNGLEYLVVKGQTVGCLYPEPMLRQSGDIDFLVHADYDTAKVITERNLDVSLPPKMNEYEVGFDRNGIRYELHTSLRGWAKKKHQEGWDNLMEKEWQEKYFVEIDEVKVRTLSPTLNAAYVFIHLFFHFIREGVSLRQLCDWAIVLHHYNAEIDKDKLIRILLELDMFDAYCAFGTILVDELGLPKREFPVSLDDNDRKWKGQILEDIFRGGNFGKLHHQAHSSWKFKVETMCVALRNSFRYYRLCPSEVGGMIPRLLKGNLKILLAK